VNSDDQVPILIFHVLEADISENARIVDEDMDATEGFDSRLDDLVTILDAVVIGNRLASGSFDFVYYHIGSL
jgi:hypothetical protein